MAISKVTKKKALREEDDLINDAAQAAPADQMAPAPQPVPMPDANMPSNNTSAASGFFPPEPGMIPLQWGFPQESAQAAVMDSGDVNMANAAPGGGVVGGAPITNEEAQLVNEYRKWSKAKKLEALKGKLAKRVKEADEEMIEDEPAEEEIAEGADVDVSDEMGLPVEGEEEEGEVVDELKDIAIDINMLFSDLGGDINEVMPDNPDAQAHEEAEEQGIEEADLDDDGEVTADEMEAQEAFPESTRINTIKAKILAKRKEARINAIRKRIAERRASKKQESELARAIDIKLPAGTPEPDVSSDVKIQAYEKKVQARRALLAELRKKAALREEELAVGDYSDANPDETRQDSIGEVIDDVMPNQAQIESREPKSAIVNEATSRSSRFVERYNEKKALDFRALLEQGLLG